MIKDDCGNRFCLMSPWKCVDTRILGQPEPRASQWRRVALNNDNPSIYNRRWYETPHSCVFKEVECSLWDMWINMTIISNLCRYELEVFLTKIIIPSRTVLKTERSNKRLENLKVKWAKQANEAPYSLCLMDRNYSELERKGRTTAPGPLYWKNFKKKSHT